MLSKPKKTRSVYLDHAATTPVDADVFRAMQPFFAKQFGNPSALYRLGVEANAALNDSRRTVADVLHTTPDTIYFTSGGTESNNLAVLGVSKTFSKPGHIIISAIEHHALLEPVEALKQWGWQVTVVPVDAAGLVRVQDVLHAIRPDTALISVMYANNEIGVIEPIADIGRALLRYRKEKGGVYPYFHTDACQAAGYLDVDVEKLHVDFMTINSGKLYGPKGVGLLFVRRGAKLQPLMYGGSQEKHLRAGTENIPGIVGFTKALELVQKNKEKEAARLNKLSVYFWNELQKKIPTCSLNGVAIGEGRLANNLNIYFPGIDGETLVIYLDSYGIMCSTGSACTAISAEPSHVLKAIGCSAERINGSLRFSMGKTTSRKDIDYAVSSLQKIIVQLRK